MKYRSSWLSKLLPSPLKDIEHGDALMTETRHEVVRYADDFVIFCQSKAEAEAILTEVQQWTKENGYPSSKKSRCLLTTA